VQPLYDLSTIARSGGDTPNPLRREPAPAPAPAPVEEGALVLQIRSGSRVQERTLRSDALLGRRDPRQGIVPQLAFNTDDAVSRRHAMIRRRKGQYYLSDLGSTNGTVVNGSAVLEGEELLLNTDDEIELGAYTRIRVLQAPALSAATSTAPDPEPIAAALPSPAPAAAPAATWSPAAAAVTASSFDLSAWDLSAGAGQGIPASAWSPRLAQAPPPQAAAPAASPHAPGTRPPDKPVDESFGWNPTAWTPQPHHQEP
jgi:predicted component of type VI protein secretion system